MTANPDTTFHAMAPLLVSYTEAARLLGGISTRTVFTLVKTGRLRAIKLTDARNSRAMVVAEDLHRFIAERGGGQPPAAARGIVSLPAA
jgi:hypothetical protein